MIIAKFEEALAKLRDGHRIRRHDWECSTWIEQVQCYDQNMRFLGHTFVKHFIIKGFPEQNFGLHHFSILDMNYAWEILPKENSDVPN